MCIRDRNNTAIEVFSGLIHSKHPGLYIGRTTKEQFQSMYPDITAQVIKLTTHTDERHRTSTDLKELYHEIENFITKNKQSVILLDRLDYLITMFSFETVVKTLYKINDQIEKHRSLLLLRLNPSLLDRKEMAVLQEEFHQLPAQQIEDVQLTESLFRILQYIHDENNRNMMVTYSKIGKKFISSELSKFNTVAEAEKWILGDKLKHARRGYSATKLSKEMELSYGLRMTDHSYYLSGATLFLFHFIIYSKFNDIFPLNYVIFSPLFYIFKIFDNSSANKNESSGLAFKATKLQPEEGNDENFTP